MANYLTEAEHKAIQAFDNFRDALWVANEAMRALARENGVPVSDYFTVACDRVAYNKIFPTAESRDRWASLLLVMIESNSGTPPANA